MIVDWFTTAVRRERFLTRGHCGPWIRFAQASLHRLKRLDRTGLLLIIAACLHVIWSKRRA